MRLTKRELIDELRITLRLFIPVFVSSVITFIQNLVNIAFVGRSGTVQDLAGVSLGVMWSNVSGVSFASGLMSAVETLCSQANGAGNFRRVGLVLQRGLLILTVFSVAVAFVWSFLTEKALLLLNQDPAVALLAESFSRTLIIGMLPSFYYEAVRRALTSAGIALPQAIAGLAAVSVLAVLDFTFVASMHLGAVGSAIAVSIANFSMLGTFVAVAWGLGAWDRYWVPPSREAFKELWPFLRLAIPGAVMLCAEWVAFEILLIFAGMISVEALAAMTILGQLMGGVFMLSYSFGVVSSSRVGNWLGGNNPTMARAQALMTVVLVLICETFAIILVLLGRRVIGSLFTKSDTVIDLIAITMPFAAALAIFDGIQGGLSGSLRGCGLQVFGAVGNLVAFYLLGIPAAAMFIFLWRKELRSIYFGLILAPLVQSIAFGARLVFFNWTRAAKEISERNKFIHQEDQGVQLLSTSDDDPRSRE